MASSSTVTLEDLQLPTRTTTPIQDDHLHYPAVLENGISEIVIAPEPTRHILKDRLYVGNLHPTVDEYTLLQVFSRFGKVTKLDFLFHKTGLLKGKPRGYAFVEYGNKEDALKALTKAHEKPLRGRTLVVTFAHQAPLDQYGGSGMSSSKTRKTLMETGRPTTLSMLKTGPTRRHEGKTGDKIAMMEAKLRQMESTNPRPAKPNDASSKNDPDPSNRSSTPTPPTASTALHHPSLPAKPPPTVPRQTPMYNIAAPQPRPPIRAITTLPELPFLPPTQNQTHLLDFTSRNSSSPNPMVGSSSQQRSGKSSKFIGVKMKPKEKAAGN